MIHLLAALAVVASVSAADMPLTASHLVVGPNSRVTLTNTADQPVTAWGLATVTHPAGGRTHREIEIADGYLSEVTHGLPGASTRLERLAAGQSREISLDAVPEGATVEVIAVVLNDGTAMGDEPVIREIFARRVKERDALGAVADAFRDVLRAQQGVAALDALRNRLTTIAQREQSLPCRAALDAVEMYRTKSANPAAIDQSLGTYAAFVTREYEIAAKHAQRKP
ncbi:MAG TPA: hypothetical protein VG222_07145 [Vicinamibacterales bacterium]|jgi:hypothetical protein|nr:hypothetical protein [Vicinamibacterales bacterium]